MPKRDKRFDRVNHRAQRRYNKLRRNAPDGWKYAPLPHNWKEAIKKAMKKEKEKNNNG